jgi:hypothetical protein
MKYSADGLCRFDPSNHTYWVGNKRLKGVTSLIKNYVEEFDMQGQAFKYAAKHKLDPYEVMKMWKKKGLDARIAGTAIHNVFEKYCETGELTWNQGVMKEIVAIKFIKDYFLSGRLKPVCWECLVYQNNTASMIDLVAVNNKAELFILDYKSSKEISKDGWGRIMKMPFQEYPDANYYHYSLQTSIYRKMYGQEIKEAYIVHIGETDYQLIKTENIHVPDWVL